MRMVSNVILFLAVLLGAFSTTANGQTGCVQEKICLKVVSQRAMTENDVKRINALSLRRSVVRLRLSNDSRSEIVYLTGLDSVVPIGFRLATGPKAGEPKYLPEIKDRTESSLSSLFGGSLKYLSLPPGSVLEFDLPDWGNPARDVKGTKHAFSIFIKRGGVEGGDIPVELISEAFAPIP